MNRDLVAGVKKFIFHKAVKNAGWLVMGKIMQMIISLFVSLLVARYLGPSNYGLINYAAAYTAFFTSICTLGINSILVKELVDAPESEGEILGTALGMKTISSILSAITIISIVFVVDAGEKETLLIAALTTIGMIFHVFETFNYWFQYRLESKVTAIATLIAYGVTSLYRVVLLITGKSVTWFAFASSIDYICLAAILYLAYRKRKGAKLTFSITYGKQLLGKSYHFILSGLMIAVYGQVDKLMLRQMINDAEIGYYSTAAGLCNMWCFVLSAIIASAYPSIMNANRTDQELFRKRNKQLYAIVFYISVSVSLIFTIAGPFIIWILYGEAYLPAAGPLRILTWCTAFSYLGVARDAWVMCNDCQKYLKYLYFVAAIMNVILNALLIPKLGAEGAATASLLAQILTIMVPVFIKDMRENVRWIIEAIMLKGVFK